MYERNWYKYMEKMVNVFFFGKRYSVPAELTIMTAMEYAGYTLKRGCAAVMVFVEPAQQFTESKVTMN